MAELIVLDESEAGRQYDDMLDDCNEMVRIGTLEYTPSYVLKTIDPIAYREGFLEYVDYLVECDVFVTGYTENEYPERSEEHTSELQSH